MTNIGQLAYLRNIFVLKSDHTFRPNLKRRKVWWILNVVENRIERRLNILNWYLLDIWHFSDFVKQVRLVLKIFQSSFYIYYFQNYYKYCRWIPYIKKKIKQGGNNKIKPINQIIIYIFLLCTWKHNKENTKYLQLTVYKGVRF